MVSPVVPLFTAPLAMPAPRSGRLALLEAALVGLAVAGETAESPVVVVEPVVAFCANAHDVEKMTADAAAMITRLISGLRHVVRGWIADAINIAGDPMREAGIRSGRLGHVRAEPALRDKEADLIGVGPIIRSILQAGRWMPAKARRGRPISQGFPVVWLLAGQARQTPVSIIRRNRLAAGQGIPDESVMAR